MANARLLLISLDALSREDASILLDCPVFGRLAANGTFVDYVDPVYLSNTYPIHTSIVTGCQPSSHGIYDNALPQPGVRRPDWYWFASSVKRPTIYAAAAAAGLKTAGILWPVTAGAAAIRYNIPEIVAKRKGQHQVLLSLKNGSPLLTLASVLKYGRRLSGEKEPALSDFATATMCDIIRRKKPHLMMLHLIDADTHKHDYGVDSSQAKEAVRRMDRRLGDLEAALKQAGIFEETHIILLSDHGMTNVQRSFNPNRLLEPAGLIGYGADGSLDFWKVWIKCSGGSGFLYLHDPADSRSLETARTILSEAAVDPKSGIAGFIDKDEFQASGLDNDCPLGILASEGTEFVEYPKYAHRANHGYSLKSGAYSTFYILSGPRIRGGLRKVGGSLLDIAPLAIELLGLEAWPMDGVLRTEFLTDRSE